MCIALLMAILRQLAMKVHDRKTTGTKRPIFQPRLHSVRAHWSRTNGNIIATTEANGFGVKPQATTIVRCVHEVVGCVPPTMHTSRLMPQFNQKKSLKMNKRIMIFRMLTE
jgi:hypothetical protein